MYFSRIKVKTENLGYEGYKNLNIGNAYGCHQLLWGLFPDEPDAQRDFLFRQEFEQEQSPDFKSRKKGLPLFYLISKRRPEPSQLLDVKTKDYDPKIKVGEKFTFELRANPVVARKEEGRKRSKKHDVLMDAKMQGKKEKLGPGELKLRIEVAAKNWLIQRSSNSGFLVEGDDIEINRYFQNHFFKKGSSSVKFNSIDYQGILQVNNIEKFRNLLFEGLGRSKGFGCGMMMIRRLRG